MQQTINVIQVIIALLLIAAIALQQKGSGLGGGSSLSGKTYHSKKGAEKVLFTSTIVLAVLFLLSSIINIMLR